MLLRIIAVKPGNRLRFHAPANTGHQLSAVIVKHSAVRIKCHNSCLVIRFDPCTGIQDTALLIQRDIAAEKQRNRIRHLLLPLGIIYSFSLIIPVDSIRHRSVRSPECIHPDIIGHHGSEYKRDQHRQNHACEKQPQKGCAPASAPEQFVQHITHSFVSLYPRPICVLICAPALPRAFLSFLMWLSTTRSLPK